MKTKLIEALRAVAGRLAAGIADYNWGNVDKCNCGLLAQELLGLDSGGLQELRHKDYSYGWGCYAGNKGPFIGFCPTTGLPLKEVFKALADAGMERHMYNSLESLNDNAVLDRADLPRFVACCDPANVSRYMLAMASMLEESDAAQLAADLAAQDAALDAYETRALVASYPLVSMAVALQEVGL